MRYPDLPAIVEFDHAHEHMFNGIKCERLADTSVFFINNAKKTFNCCGQQTINGLVLTWIRSSMRWCLLSCYWY